MIEPDPTAFKPISKAELLGEGGATTPEWTTEVSSTQNYAPIALADGKLFIRDQYRMLCVKVAR